MDRSDRARIADPTIAAVFGKFLAEQRARLAARTFRKYEDVISLFTHSLDGYAYQWLDEEESALFHRLYDAKEDDHREFTEIFGPGHVLGNVDEFLGYFVPRKVMAGRELLRAAGTVTKKLAKWLAEKGYAESEQAEKAVERGADAARDLPAAEDLRWILDEHSEGAWELTATEEGHFEITRVEPGRIWVSDLAGAERGPIRLPPEVTERCPVAWTFSGMIGRRGKTWCIAEVWNVYPRP